MRKFISIILLSVFILSSVNIASAGILEIRGGIGMTSTDASSFDGNLQAAGANGLNTDDIQSYNLDLFLNIPVLPIGVGLRYEQASQDESVSVSGSSAKFDLDVQNISLLIDWRIIDTLFYVGPLVSIGLPSADLDFNNGQSLQNFSKSLDGENLSYSLAAEAGVHIKNFIVGAEAGYQSLELESPNTPNFNSAIDLSGFYGKLLVGLSFF